MLDTVLLSQCHITEPTHSAINQRKMGKRSIADSIKGRLAIGKKDIDKKSLFFSTTSCDSFSCPSSDETNEFERTSCLKGSPNALKKKRKQKLRFSSGRSFQTVHKIKPIHEYASDLWWTKQELEKSKSEQSNFSKVSNEIKRSAMAYMAAYVTARQQVFRPADKGSKPMMTTDAYDTIVIGRSQGFAGLELYSNESQRRRAAVREIVLLTVAAYYDFSAFKGKGSSDKMMRSYSRSLTAADRYWSVAIGNADLAAINDD